MGGRGLSPVLYATPGTPTLEQGCGQALCPLRPAWLSGLPPALVWHPLHERRLGSGGPSSRAGVGPAPTAAACLAWWPHRQTGLVRSGASRENSAPAGSCSKASLWQEGPLRAAAPAAGTDRAQPLCQCTAPALTQGPQDRGPCPREAGCLSGEKLPRTR